MSLSTALLVIVVWTAVAIVAGVFLFWTAWWQGRDFFPKTHDEQSYLLQMRMLAQGRLWMPAHELADFFETFHVEVEGVYASVYFPGTAMMYVAGLWVGWPIWLLPLMISSACVGLLYAIVTDLVDGLAGLLAAVLLLSLSWFRMLSILLMGQVPALFLGLVMFWAWLRWREARAMEGDEAAGPAPAWREFAWVLLIGACAGWMARLQAPTMAAMPQLIHDNLQQATDDLAARMQNIRDSL